MRNIINPEAIDQFIAIVARRRSELPLALALKALRRPLRNEETLCSQVLLRPDNAPSWITPERIASGELYAFDFARCDYDLIVNLQQVMRWLHLGHLRIKMSGRERRKWETSLGHIRTLQDAVVIATRQMATWSDRDLRVHCRAHGRLRHHHFMTSSTSFSIHVAQDQIVERMKLPCGAAWYQLMTAKALMIEGAEMNHCLGSPRFAIQLIRKAAVFYSLRNADLSCRLTLMVTHDGFHAVRAPNNKVIKEEDTPLVKGLLQTERPFEMEMACNPLPDERQEFVPDRLDPRRSLALAQSIARLRRQIDALVCRRDRRGRAKTQSVMKEARSQKWPRGAYRK